MLFADFIVDSSAATVIATAVGSGVAALVVVIRWAVTTVISYSKERDKDEQMAKEVIAKEFATIAGKFDNTIREERAERREQTREMMTLHENTIQTMSAFQGRLDGIDKKLDQWHQGPRSK